MNNLKEMADAMKLEALDDRAEAFFFLSCWHDPCNDPCGGEEPGGGGEG